MLRACIFDLDGTLLHTLPTVHHYCSQSLEHFGFHGISESACRSLIRQPVQTFYHELLRLGGCPESQIDRLAPAVLDYDWASYSSDFLTDTKPFPGIIDAVQCLHEHGILTAVLTNKPEKIARPLCDCFFPHLFDLVVGQTPDSISKPDERAVQAVLSHLEVPPAQAAYVGDTDVDMLTAQRGRLTNIAVTWGYMSRRQLAPYHPDHWLTRPAELPALYGIH